MSMNFSSNEWGLCQGCRERGYLHHSPVGMRCFACIHKTTHTPGTAIVAATSTHTVPTVYNSGSNRRHVYFTLKGPQPQKDLFHWVMKYKIDKRDYPIDPFYKPTTTVWACSKCHGVLWHSPVKSPSELRDLAKQLGLKISIGSWADGNKCKGTMKSLTYDQLKKGMV